MKVVIEIACDNAAFDGADGPAEVREILLDTAEWFYTQMVLRAGEKTELWDKNGNKVGMAKVKK